MNNDTAFLIQIFEFFVGIIIFFAIVKLYAIASYLKDLQKSSKVLLELFQNDLRKNKILEFEKKIKKQHEKS
jgi:hypothetical protein